MPSASSGGARPPEGTSGTPLSPETRRRVEALFDGAARETAVELLETRCGAKLPLWIPADPRGLERIRFAALKLSHGDLGELRRAVEIAQVDWRDVLEAAGFGNDPRAHEAWFPDPPDQRHPPGRP